MAKPFILMLTKSQIQLVKSLRLKKFRQKYNQFVVEGEKAVGELLQSGLKTVQVFAVAGWAQQYLTSAKKAMITEISEKDLERISGFDQPNKVLAIAEIPDHAFGPEVLEQPITIALDFIQDPGNLGTIIRIADWYGIENIICSPDCVDAYNPKVINATMGSFARVNVHYTDLETALAPVAQRVHACVMDGEPVYGLTPDKPVILIGNEGKGLNEKLVQMAGKKVSIPRRGKAESLNAAVATAVIVDNLARIRP